MRDPQGPRTAEIGPDDPRPWRWRFELEQVGGMDDLELWLEAERRKSLDESRHRYGATP
ncbi:MAG: hypothetical protein ACRD0S_02500 [Acidimicrobiales bacterium]